MIHASDFVRTDHGPGATLNIELTAETGKGYVPRHGPAIRPTAPMMSRPPCPPARLRTSGGRSRLLMVWALTDLMLGRRPLEPSIRRL